MLKNTLIILVITLFYSTSIFADITNTPDNTVAKSLLKNLQYFFYLKVGDKEITETTLDDLPTKVEGNITETIFPDLTVPDLDLYLGDILVRAEKIEDKIYSVQLVFSQEIIMGEPEYPQLKITVDHQNHKGLWHTDLNDFYKLDSEFSDISFELYTAPIAQIKAMKTISDYSVGEEFTEGYSKITLHGLDIKETVNINTIELYGEIAGFPTLWQNQEAIYDELAIFLEDINHSLYDLREKEIRTEFVNKLKILTAPFHNMSVGIDINDIQVNNMMLRGGALDNIHFEIGIEDLVSSQTNSYIALDINGFKAPSYLLPDTIIENLPHHFSTKIEIEKLPMLDIWQATLNALEKGPKDLKTAFKIAATRMGFAILREQTGISFSKKIEANQANLEVSGHVYTNANSPFLATATLLVQAKGINTLIETFRNMGMLDDKTLGFVEFARNFAEIEGEGKEEIWNIAIELTEPGNILLNNEDASTLFDTLFAQ